MSPPPWQGQLPQGPPPSGPGAPPPGMPPAPMQQGYAAPPQPVPVVVTAAGGGTNGLAIGSLVCGILGISLIAVILGHMALSQINRTNEEGRGLAIAGLVLGYLGLVAVVVALILVFVALTATTSTY